MIAKKWDLLTLSADTSQTDSFKQRQKKGQVIEDTLTLGKKQRSPWGVWSGRELANRGDSLFQLAANYDDFAKIIP